MGNWLSSSKMEEDQPGIPKSRANFDRQLALLASARNKAESSNIIKQLDGASSDDINQGHEVLEDDPDLSDIEQADQESLEALNQGPEDAPEEPQIGGIEQADLPSLGVLDQEPEDAPDEPQIGGIEPANQASLGALNQEPEDAPEEPQIGGIEQTDQPSLEALNQEPEDALEEPESGEIEQANQASLEALIQEPEDAPEEPQIGGIEQTDQPLLEALNQEPEDALDEPESGEIEQANQASLEALNQGPEDAPIEAESGDIEQTDQPLLEALNQEPEDALEEPESGEIEQANQASLEALNQGPEDAPEEPQIGGIEQADLPSLEAPNQGHQNSPKELESGDTQQPNQKPSGDSSGQWPKDIQGRRESSDGSGSEDANQGLYTHDDPELCDNKQYGGDLEQENASSAKGINLKDKAISDENAGDVPPFEDHKKMPDAASITSSEDLQDFIEVMNDGPVDLPLEDLNQFQSLETVLSSAEEGEVCNALYCDCEEGEVLTDDNDDDDSFYNSGKKDICHSTPFTKENNYRMFEKKQLPMPNLEGASNFLMGLQKMPHAFKAGMQQPDADPFYSQAKSHMRIGPLLPTPLFIKSLPFDLTEAPNRNETYTRKTTEIVGAPISCQSAGGDTTKEAEGSSSFSNLGKKSISGDSSPRIRKRNRSPLITLKRSRSRFLSPSVSPPRYGYSKRRRCRSRSRRFSPSTSSSRSPKRSPSRRRKIHGNPTRRRSRRSSSPPMRRRSRSPFVRRRSPSPLARRRSPSPLARCRSRSPPARRRSPHASKQSRGLVRPTIQNASNMAPRKRKISTSSSNSYNATDDSASSSDSSFKRALRREKTLKKGPKTPPDSPPPEDASKSRKKFLLNKLLLLNEKIEAAKKLRQMKMMKLSSNLDPRFKN
ncbi:uncharacterized protein LOC108163958 isoform X2 [Drosophila miranda]|uniref:uncharacterized protein LOC108163958 isoform X2 n=1 Tax=Drosophila miranda TaxID=7229 RepID=UPI0007E71847|nr:uncharacterized protein LOC108163958 isoform X2 [Drosophila miranda]XP_033249319.1 uncharacterized protein LOC108163958 isoform X2 [Drosophila miranda]